MTVLGGVKLVAYGFAPRGYAPCDGRVLPVARHPELFDLLGAAHGGDGRQTFALPDLRDLVPPLKRAGAANAPLYAPRDRGGTGAPIARLSYIMRVLPRGECTRQLADVIAGRSEDPAGTWLPCDGRALPVSGYRSLYSLLGCGYGGDGEAVFALPDLSDAPGGPYSICIRGAFPSRS